MDAKRKAKLLLDNKGNEFLTQLEATLELSDKLDSLTEAVKSIPETVIPEYPEPVEEVVITNLPEVQKVEITNLPSEKDDKEQLALLKEISQELKKKEQYAYDIEIDPALKEQLRGDRGEDGITPIKGVDYFDGNDGSPDTPQEIVGKLSTLSGEERLDARYIKNLPEPRVTGGAPRALSNLYDVNITTPTDGQALVYDAPTQKWKNGTVSGGSGSPGGSDTQVQFNDGGAFGGDPHFTFDKVNDVLHVHKIAGDATDGLVIESANGTDVGILGPANTANVTWYGSHNYDNQTANTIAGFGASKTLQSLPTTTYPSLTELSYVKGVTSDIQTQIGNKQDTLVSGTNIKTVNGNSLLGSGNLVISGGASMTEVEVDFGNTPVYDKTITVTDAGITGSSKIMVTESGNPATGQGTGDTLWDSITYSAVAGTGSFTLYARPTPGPVMGKRKIYYTVA